MSMVSPSFFRSALVDMKEERIQDISAIVLEHSSIAMQSESLTNTSRIKESELQNVGIKIVRKDAFAAIDIHSSGNDYDVFDWLEHDNEVMNSLVASFTDMLARAWQSNAEEILFDYDTAAVHESIRAKFEVKVTCLEENAIVMVVRNVSERYRRFEAEKRFVFETTARQKDAQANRFTRHEVKNGLLAAIEICGNVREQMSDDMSQLQKDLGNANHTSAMSEKSLSGKLENMTELESTLHDVLDIILAETVCP